MSKKTVRNIVYALGGATMAVVGMVFGIKGSKELLFEKKEVVDAVADAAEEVE